VYEWATKGNRVKITRIERSHKHFKVTLRDLEGTDEEKAVDSSGYVFTEVSDRYGNPHRYGYILEGEVADPQEGWKGPESNVDSTFRWPAFHKPTHEEQFLFRMAWKYIDKKRKNPRISQADFVRGVRNNPSKGSPVLTKGKLSRALGEVLDSSGRTGREILEAEQLRNVR
jgi:hypothetical protein